MPDSQILEIFARLNTYTAVLKPQEKLNAKYFGDFKQTAYKLGFKFVDFYTTNGVLSDREVSRMAEAELTSELLIGILDGIQSRKVIENYYKKFDEAVPNKDKIINNFEKTIDIIGSIFGKELKNSNFAREHVFYSLFLSLYDLFFGLKNSKVNQIKFSEDLIPRIRNILNEIDDIWEVDEIPRDAKSFFDATRRGTTDIKARNTRHEYILKKLTSGFH